MNYSELSPEELFRACAQTSDAAAWGEFIRRFHRLIATVVLRAARRWGQARAEIVEELVQETYLKLCAHDARLLRAFTPRHEGAVFGYLKVVAANLAHDHFKALHSQKRGTGQESRTRVEPDGMQSQESIAGEDAAGIERRVLFAELDGHLRAVVEGPHAVRDRRIFWLHYRMGVTAEAIAALPGVGLSRKGVETVLFRTARALRHRVAAHRLSGATGAARVEGIQSSRSFS